MEISYTEALAEPSQKLAVWGESSAMHSLDKHPLDSSSPKALL
jgi:hypothetical protein